MPYIYVALQDVVLLLLSCCKIFVQIFLGLKAINHGGLNVIIYTKRKTEKGIQSESCSLPQFTQGRNILEYNYVYT